MSLAARGKIHAWALLPSTHVAFAPRGPLVDCPLMPEPDDRGRRLAEDCTIAELHAIATRALAEGDGYGRRPLREQLIGEEFAPQ